jgi:AcrR family transcriptional regulator
VPRRVNEADYATKRNEILDAAQRLIYSKGYAQMTIQDLLDALRISKGAFYHYFDSKQAVLEGLIEQLIEQGEQLFLPIVGDRDTPTLARLQRFFDETGRWKTAQKAYMLALLRVWYADDNAIVRQKTKLSVVRHFAPLLTQLVTQGHDEGVLIAPFPDQAGSIVMTLLVGLSESLAELLLAPALPDDALPRAERLIEAYNDALERVLGAPPGSLHLLDHASAREWFAVVSAETVA